eukprot:TRINITY_DN188_c0_g1_i4.p1 TRINITY_DN188_c0_g1~~TRINITY_DN188_c0_g1_i4.p1  ORF type:complete len:593 (+),score=140.22 TRINITY_DN188_c0_g1_i4:494-2272(+)
MLPEHLMYLIHDMLEGFIQITWKPFERAIQRGLEAQGRQMADFDGLVKSLTHRRAADGFDMAQRDGDCAHLQVDWVTKLAHHMLEVEQFTTYDVANLEILVHLYAYYLLPVRPESLMGNLASQVWAKMMVGQDGRVSYSMFQDIANAELGKIAMSGGGDDGEPMKTCVPVPAELNRPMLTVLFLCRAMRTIRFGSAVPDRLVGLSGGCNRQVKENTFREKVLNEIGRCNLGIPYYASYSNRSTAVTEIYEAARKMCAEGRWGEAQDFIISSMKELHSSVAAAKSAYRQFEALRSSQVQNRGKRSQFVEADGEGNVDVPRPPPALRPMPLAANDSSYGGGGGSCGGGSQAIAEMAAAAIANMQNVHAASIQGAVANMQKAHMTSMQQMQATHTLALQQFQKVHKTNYRRTSQLHDGTLQKMSEVHSRTLQQNAAAHRAYIAEQQQLSQQQAKWLAQQQQLAQQQAQRLAQQQQAQQGMFLNFLYMQQRGMYSPYGNPPQTLRAAHNPAVGYGNPSQMLPVAHAHAIHQNALPQQLPLAHAHAIHNPQMLPAAHVPAHIQQSPPGFYHYSHASAQSEMYGPARDQSPSPGTPPM